MLHHSGLADDSSAHISEVFFWIHVLSDRNQFITAAKWKRVLPEEFQLEPFVTITLRLRKKISASCVISHAWLTSLTLRISHHHRLFGLKADVKISEA